MQQEPRPPEGGPPPRSRAPRSAPSMSASRAENVPSLNEIVGYGGDWPVKSRMRVLKNISSSRLEAAKVGRPGAAGDDDGPNTWSSDDDEAAGAEDDWDRWERPFRYQPARPSSAPQGPLKPPASSSLGRILRASLDTLPSTPAPALRPFARSPLPPVPASPEGPCEEQLARIATLSVVPQIRPMTVEAGPGPASTAAAASHIEKRNGGAGAEDSGPPSRGESGAGGAGDGDEEKPSWVSNDLFGAKVDGLPGEASSAVLSFTERKGLPPRAVVGGPSTAVR